MEDKVSLRNLPESQSIPPAQALSECSRAFISGLGVHRVGHAHGQETLDVQPRPGGCPVLFLAVPIIRPAPSRFSFITTNFHPFHFPLPGSFKSHRKYRFKPFCLISGATNRLTLTACFMVLSPIFTLSQIFELVVDILSMANHEPKSQPQAHSSTTGHTRCAIHET